MPDDGVGVSPAKVPAIDETVLAFDFGTRRIGVAIGNSVTRTARPLAIIDATTARRWAAIGELVTTWQPQRLVVGVPRYADGNAHAMTAQCERFARQLRGRFVLTVDEVDERYSTVAVADPRAGAPIDDRAAAVILQAWFDAAAAAAAVSAAAGPSVR